MVIGLLMCVGSGCIKRDPKPYAPARPEASGSEVAAPTWTAATMDRELAGIEAMLRDPDASPARVYERIERLFRGILGANDGLPSEEHARVIASEIDGYERSLEQLGISVAALWRQRFDNSRPEERERFRAASRLALRWGLASMRLGGADARVAGAERLADAANWADDDALSALLLSAYEDAVGFRSNARARLDRFSEEHGPHAVVDLTRVRKLERAWKITGLTGELHSAKRLLDEMRAARSGFDTPWLLLEEARLAFFEDSIPAARRLAAMVLEAPENRLADSLSAIDAGLLLGLLEVRALEFERAERRFEQTRRWAERRPERSDLAAWMRTPWDLWTPENRIAFDTAPDPDGWIEQYWRSSDPILATPRVLENRLEYYRRVAEAHFAFSDLDPAATGPSTDPGRAVLRFGWPTTWRNLGARPLLGHDRESPLDFSVFLTWEFVYELRLPGASGLGPRFGPGPARQMWLAGNPRLQQSLIFQERAGTSRFVRADSLDASIWPPFLFRFDFLGLGYPLHARITRFRAPEGGVRLLVSFDTCLPDYSVRYPLQGLRFEGDAEVATVLYGFESARRMQRSEPIARRTGPRTGGAATPETNPNANSAPGTLALPPAATPPTQPWRVLDEADLLLAEEVRLPGGRELRRRSALFEFAAIDSGVVRVASRLLLRREIDTDGDGDADGEAGVTKIVGIGVDNGQPFSIRGFSADTLDASDLLLASSIQVHQEEERDRTLPSGVIVNGPELRDLAPVARAGEFFLPGEEIAYYLELYNVEPRAAGPSVEVSTALERLDDRGVVDYRVTLRTGPQRLRNSRATQWNLVRQVGFGDLEPGRYRLAVRLVEPASGRHFSRSAEFVVVSPEDVVEYYRWRDLEQ